MKNDQNTLPANYSAERLVAHECRRAARLYRGVLGHEQRHLIAKTQGLLDFNGGLLTGHLQTLGHYKTTRILIKSVRLIVLRYLKQINALSAPIHA